MRQALHHAEAALRAASPTSRAQQVRMHILCPNCMHPAKASHKRQLSRIVTELTYHCGNPACGGGFVFLGEAHRWVRLPASLDPAIRLPLSPFVNRRGLFDALRTLPVAELPTRGEAIGAPLVHESALQADDADACGHWAHLFAEVRHGA